MKNKFYAETVCFVPGIRKIKRREGAEKDVQNEETSKMVGPDGDSVSA